MELRIKTKLSPEQEKRWNELTKILGTKDNAKTIKKLIEVVKL